MTLDPSQPPQAPRGFSTSGKRVVAELAIVAGALGALVAGVVWLGGLVVGHLVPWVPVDVDRLLGRQGAAQVALEFRPCDDPAAARYMDQLLLPLTNQLHTPFDFELTVLDTPVANAWALPGGHLYVTAGLLARAKTGTAVAGVIAHEITHVTERHSLSRILRAIGVGGFVRLMFGGTGFDLPASWLSQLTTIRYDRGEEAKADAGAATLLRGAQLNPSDLADLLEALGDDVQVPAFLSDHPDPGDRAQALRAQALPNARELPPPVAVNCR